MNIWAFCAQDPAQNGRREHTPAAGFPQLVPAEADGILVRGEKSGAVKRLQVALGLVADGDFSHIFCPACAALHRAYVPAARAAAHEHWLYARCVMAWRLNDRNGRSTSAGGG